MLELIANKIKNFHKNEQGLETIEYVLIAVAVVIGAWLAYQALGGAVTDYINNNIIDKLT